MQIIVRMIEGKTVPERTVTNIQFNSVEDNRMKLMPIPEFQTGNCYCGKKADYMIDEKTFICANCVDKQSGCTVLSRIESLGFPSLEHKIRTTVFEWTIVGDSWYRIHGSNIIFQSNQRITQEEKRNSFLAKMEKVFLGEPQSFTADYQKEIKRLTVFI